MSEFQLEGNPRDPTYPSDSDHSKHAEWLKQNPQPKTDAPIEMEGF